MARRKMSKEEFKTLVEQLRKEGVKDKALTRHIVRRSSLKQRTAQEYLRELTESGLPPLQSELKYTGAYTGRMSSSGANLSNPPRTESEGAGPSTPNSLRDAAKMLSFGLSHFEMDRELRNMLKDGVDALKGLKEIGESLMAAWRESQVSDGPAKKEVLPIALLMDEDDVYLRSRLNKTIEDYGAWVHPKLNGDTKWPETTGACIQDLKHRTKDFLSVKEWAEITGDDVFQASAWLAKATHNRWDGFRRLQIEAAQRLAARAKATKS